MQMPKVGKPTTGVRALNLTSTAQRRKEEIIQTLSRNGPFQQIGEYSKLHHEHQLLQKEFHALKLSNQLLQSKVTDIQLKLSTELTRVSSLEHDLKVKQSTLGQICRDKEATEKKLSEALFENNKLQRSLVKGSKGTVAAEKKLEVKDQLKLAIEDRDRYEAYFNTAQYEMMKRDKQIAALENALIKESMSKKKKKDQNDSGEKVVIFDEYKELKELLAQETKIRTSLQERNQILMKQLNLEQQKSVRKSSAGIRVTSSLVQSDEGHEKLIEKYQAQISKLTSRVLRLEREKSLQQELVEDKSIQTGEANDLFTTLDEIAKEVRLDLANHFTNLSPQQLETTRQLCEVGKIIQEVSGQTSSSSPNLTKGSRSPLQDITNLAKQ